MTLFSTIFDEEKSAETLGGTIAFLTDKGFEIRISVPKMSKTRGTR